MPIAPLVSRILEWIIFIGTVSYVKQMDIAIVAQWKGSVDQNGEKLHDYQKQNLNDYKYKNI